VLLLFSYKTTLSITFAVPVDPPCCVETTVTEPSVYPFPPPPPPFTPPFPPVAPFPPLPPFAVPAPAVSLIA